MASHSAAVSDPVAEFAAALLAQSELDARARIVAREVRRVQAGCSVLVYAHSADGVDWSAKATAGDLQRPRGVVAASTGVLAAATERRAPVLYHFSDLPREQYAHLDIRRNFASLAVVPVVNANNVIGLIELVSFEQPLTNAELSGLGYITQCAGLALGTAQQYEDERNAQLRTINRLTQLYDLERTFNSTLEMDKLLPIVTEKVRDVLEVEAVNLWMVQDDDLLLVDRNGDDPSYDVGAVLGGEEGIPGECSKTSKPLAIRDANDPRLVARTKQKRIRSVMAVPIVSQGFQVGILEAVNRIDGQPFSEDDLFFLDTIQLTAGGALHNASLLEAERKIEILETLVEVSREITSTLNLERVLAVVVNAPQRIMAYDRAALAMLEKGKLELKAISGKNEINPAEPAMVALREMLEFCNVSDGETFVTAPNNKVNVERPETRARFVEYFKSTGHRGWYSIPLEDDEGRLGMLSFESRQADFLSDAHLELIRVLAAQATVALRNASLYTEVPFISVLEPILQKKQAFMRLEKSRRRLYTMAAVAAAVFFIAVPFPMRVDGMATVAPQRTATVQAPFDGVIRRVLVHEGDRIARGAVLAELDDWDIRSSLANAQARYAQANSDMNRALAANDGSEAGIQRVQADYWASEVTRARERLERTHMRSPIDGIVVTPHIEDMTGRKLDVGDTIGQVVDTSQASVDVAIDQEDLPLLRAGETASVKLDGYPTRKFRGTVQVVSPAGMLDGEHRVFSARINVPNEDGSIRAGMQGRGKVWAGWRPAGYVMFRGLGMWTWTRIWNWFGW